LCARVVPSLRWPSYIRGGTKEEEEEEEEEDEDEEDDDDDDVEAARNPNELLSSIYIWQLAFFFYIVCVQEELQCLPRLSIVGLQ
jgi:hypothetical protein